MQDLELSPRLAQIAEQIPVGARLVDVGTDHAYLPVSLLRRGTIAEAMATDINAGPLERGRETARAYGVEGQIRFYRADGLDGVPPEAVDTVVIAGMGGELISHILEKAPWTKDCRLLLQPMSSQPELRQWLIQNGYAVLEEAVVREGRKLYVVLTVEAGETEPYSLAELWVGRQQNTPHRLAYVEDVLRRRKRAFEGMQQGDQVSEAELAQEQTLCRQLETMREELVTWQR